MRTRRLHRASLATVIGLSLYLLAVVPMAAADSECTLAAHPPSGPAGSTFLLRGEGFTPTRLVLQRESDAAVTLDLDLGDDDPFEIPIGSSPGHEGRWTATAVSAECTVETTFTVTLMSTDTLDELLGPGGRATLPPLVALAVIAFGFAAGALIGRRVVRA